MPSHITRYSLPAAALAVAVALSGCGGGKKFVRDDSNYNPTPPEQRGSPEPPAGSASSAWSHGVDNSEYSYALGLERIKAAEGYAARVTGKPGGAGKTVAVLDTDVDLTHPDLDGQRFAFENSRASTHGTHVAGTIAARRDGRGIHGVAYNAWLKVIAVLEDAPTGSVPFPVIGDSQANVAAGIASAAGLKEEFEFRAQTGNAYADLGCVVGVGGLCRVESNPEAEADIINMSIGGADPLDEIKGAMEMAAGENKIMIAALGNGNRTGPGSLVPAAYVMLDGVAGKAIAVGASGQGASGFSNRCRGVARYCLFAPGTNRSTILDHEYGTLSGTSMAAPHVSGAAAVVWAAFPNKTAEQIVERLLWTADPNWGVDGREVTFTSTVAGFEGMQRPGHELNGFGHLNLERAMAPWGDVGVPTEGGDVRSVATSFVNLPPGFRAPEGMSALSNIVVHDEQMFPFLYNLNDAFRESKRPDSDHMLERFLSSLGGSSYSPIGKKTAIGFTYESDAQMNPGGHSDGEEVEEYWLHFQPAPNMALTLGRGFNPVGTSNDLILNRSRRALFQDGLSVSPFSAFAGHGSATSLDWRLNDDTTLDFAGKQGSSYFDESTSAWLASTGLTHRIGRHLTLGARHGMLQENDTLMGIHSEGAFQGLSDAATNFFDISVEARLLDDMTLFGGASHGIARGGESERNSLVSGWSDIHAESFVVGGEFRNLLGTDRLILTAGSPFRPSKAVVRMSVPDAEIADGVFTYATRNVDLTPKGRETRLQLVYETDDSQGMSFVAGGYMRMEPDHDEEADTEYGAAAKMRLRF